MAQLKDLLVNGSARVIGSLFANLSGNVLNFGVCSTAAATAAKTVTTNGTFELITGSKILVLFSETDSSNAPTLNVNGTGAKSIKINASDGIGKGFLVAQQYYWFVYDGTNWRTAGAGITQIIPTQYGGTGNSSYTANRPLFYNGTRIIGSITNYINDTQLAINKTSITSGYNFEVNGNSNLIGSVTVGTSTSGALGIAQTDGAGRGISLYNGPASAMPDYGIAFAKTATFGTHGAVTSDWATYFTMSNTTTRGWIFRRGSTNVASIDGTGKLYLGYAASAANPGIYWNPYVESASDGSDVSAIYQIKSGVAGGTELRISQANDATDVINIVSPQFIYLNSKKTFRINDAWLRINEDKGFSSGIYTGSSLVRTDNQFQVGDSGNKFYANSSGNGYFSNTLGIGGTNTSYKLYVNGTSLHTNTININPNTVAIDFRYNDDRLHSTISYQTSGNEALVFANKYDCASFLFITNEDSVTNHGSDRWKSLTSAGLQIKENCVQIGGLWGNDVHPDYKLKVNGTSYFTNNMFIHRDRSLIQYQNDSSNYTALIKWYKGSKSQNTYDPQIGQHNIGGADGSGSICVLPYATSTDPWGGSVGLYICRGQAKLDGHRLLTSHYAAIDSGVKLTSGYSWISIAGTSSFTCPDGTAITQPGGANPMVLYSGAASARDCGIFYLSNDNAYVANSSDNAYTFGVFDTDITQNFSTEGNASLCVRSNGVGTFVRSRLGVNGINDSYNLYVNGTSYFNGNAIFNGHLIPNTTNTYDLGSSSNKWKNIYATTLNGNLAKKLTIQANGVQKGQFNNSADVTVNLGNVVQDFTGVNSGNAASINADTFAGMTRQQWLNTVYPIGSIYMSVSATSPATLFGGTWESLGGRFLIGQDGTYTAGSTGGEASHTLTLAEAPAHTHTRGTMNITGYFIMDPSKGYIRVCTASGAFYSSGSGARADGGSSEGSYPIQANFDASRTWSGETDSKGGGSAHNNMPPYLAVYMWKRTA